MNVNIKSPRSREPQAYSRKSGQTLSNSHYSRKIRVGKKVVGKVEGDVFVKSVNSKKHFLRTPPAISFDVDSLQQAIELGASCVKIIDLDTGNVYRVTIEIIYEKGFYFNRGWGNQIGLTLNHWQCDSSKATGPCGQKSNIKLNNQPISPDVRNSRNGNTQLNLFT
jgi:hypothetical protein